MLLEHITMPEFIDGLKKTQTVIIPFGTIEEHGSHLPLSTDTIQAVETARLASEQVPVFVAAPMHYGVCTSTSQHPGTVGITPETLRRITRDVVRSLHRHGLRGFILATGHGGSLHSAALREVAEELIYELADSKFSIITIYDLVDWETEVLVETKHDSHAGEVETSDILFLRPELVKGRDAEAYPQRPDPFVARDKLKFWPGGVWGNPAKASVEKGERSVRLMAERLAGIVKKMEVFEP